MDDLESAIDRIQAAQFARDAGDKDWAFGLLLAIADLSRCVKENWQWSDADTL